MASPAELAVASAFRLLGEPGRLYPVAGGESVELLYRPARGDRVEDLGAVGLVEQPDQVELPGLAGDPVVTRGDQLQVLGQRWLATSVTRRDRRRLIQTVQLEPADDDNAPVVDLASWRGRDERTYQIIIHGGDASPVPVVTLGPGDLLSAVRVGIIEPFAVGAGLSVGTAEAPESFLARAAVMAQARGSTEVDVLLQVIVTTTVVVTLFPGAAGRGGKAVVTVVS